METYFEILGEILEGPSMVFAGIMARKVGGAYIRDGFGIYTYDLKNLVSPVDLGRRMPGALTFRLLSSSADTCGAIMGVSLPSVHCGV